MRILNNIYRILRTGVRTHSHLRFLLAAIVTLAATCTSAQVTFTGTQVVLASGTWSGPAAASVDGKGNVFIADRGNNRIVMLAPTATGFAAPVTILSGLSAPAGVAADWNGNIFVCDTGNNRILKLPLVNGVFGNAVTIAAGFNAPIGIAVDSADNLYVADSGNNQVVELPWLGASYGPAASVSSGLNAPMGVAVDANRNLLIADTGNQRVIREPYTAGAYPTQQIVLANTIKPVSVSVDKSGNLYFADSLTSRVMEMTWYATGNRFLSPLVLGAGFLAPAGAAEDANGNVYVVDSASSRVTELVSSGMNFNSLSVGTAGAELTYNFNISAGVTVGAVNILTQGAASKDFVDAGGSTCIAQTYTVQTYCSVNVAFAPLVSGGRSGSIVLADAGGNPLVTIYISGVGLGSQLAVFPGTSTTLGTQLSNPSGVAVDGIGNLYIADTGNNRVVELPWTGSDFGPQFILFQSGLINPIGLAIDGAGNLYIASNGNDKIVKLPWMGTAFGQPMKIGTGFSGPSAVTVDSKGYLYVSDTLDARVDQFTWTGTAYANEVPVGTNHRAPTGVAADGSGNVYFTDPYQNQISEVPCCVSHYAAQVDMNSVQTSFPSAVAVDGSSNLYVADTNNNRVVLLPWSGTSYSKQITMASGFNAPAGIAVDGKGQLFVADSGNNRIVRIDLSSPAPMSFANAYLGSESPDGSQIAQIQNTGNEPLSITLLSYPPDFPESQGISNPCLADSSVGPGQFCEVGVTFTPQKAGSPLKEAVQITAASSSSVQPAVTVAVIGTSQGKLSQSITFATPAGLTYGAAPFFLSGAATSGLPVTYTLLGGPAVLQNGGKAIRITGAGTVQLSVDQSGNSTYWVANTLNVSLIVAPATLTVTAANPIVSYGSIPANIGYAITGFVNGDTALTTLTGKPSITSTATSTGQVGSYPIVTAQGTLGALNYVFSFPPATLTVVKARLYVEVNSVIRYYGSPMNPLTWYLSGFVNGDTAAVATGAPILSSPANSGSAVGTYTITVSPGTLAAANYFFTGSTGVVIVNPGLITITPASLSMIYGAPVPQLTYWISGLANGDSPDVVHGSPVLSTAAGLGPVVGTYTIASQLGSLSAANYTFRLSTGVLTVNKAPLILTPVNAAMTYGGKVPSFTYTLAGLLNGDTTATAVIGVPAFSTPANSTSKPGTYMVVSGAGTLQSANYRFSFSTAALTIGKSTLIVTTNPISKIYGAAVPALTYGFSGLLNGDGSSAIQGQPQLSTTATSASAVGTYPIACNVGSLTSSSYNFTCEDGNVTVNKATLTVKGSYLAMTYGGQAPVLTYQLMGFVNGDDATSVSGTPSLTSSVTSANAVGVYPVVVTAGSLKADNYIFAPSSGSITVQKAQLRVAAVPASSVYGSALPSFSYAISGFVNGDTQQGAVTGTPQLSIAATSASPAGNYAITPAPGTLASSNYNFVFVATWLTVNKAPLTVSANNLTMQAGGTVPALSYSFSGWINGDGQATSVTGSPVLTTSATSNSAAGVYTIAVAPGSLSSRNYQPVCVNGTLIASQTTATLHRVLPN